MTYDFMTYDVITYDLMTYGVMTYDVMTPHKDCAQPSLRNLSCACSFYYYIIVPISPECPPELSAWYGRSVLSPGGHMWWPVLG